MFDLYSVEQAEDAIVPTIVLSSTPPEQLVFRLYDVDTLRQPAHTILFDFFGRNFLQSFFLPGFPLLAPQRLLLRLCEISLPSTSNSKWTISSESNTFSTAGTSSSTFWVLFETHSHRPATSGRLIRGRTPLLHRRDFSSTFRVLFENSLHHYQQADPFFEFEHPFPTASDFFFHFLRFARKLRPSPATRKPSIHQDGFLQHSRAVVPHHRAR